MTVQADDDVLVTVEVNGRPVRVRGGRFSEREFRAGLRRSGVELGADEAIGLRTRPDEAFVSVLADTDTVLVREGLEVWTGNRNDEIEVQVNNTRVVLMGPVQTVAAIKGAAAAQGAELPDEFVLGIVHGRSAQDLDDDQYLFVLSGTRFLAVGHDDDAGLDVHSPVAEAIDILLSHYPGAHAEADGDKGAFIRIEDALQLNEQFVQDSTWVGFQITGMFPAADIYPHHVRPDLAYRSGAALQPPFHAGQRFPGTGEPSTMVSRSGGNHQVGSYSGPEVAYIKLMKVQKWLNSRH